MAVSKVTLNGSTLMDTTGVTVDESNLLTGNTALDNSGTLITGTATAGEDIPVFTVVMDSSWESVESITCNKTYSECYDLVDSGNSVALFSFDDPEYPYTTGNESVLSGTNYIRYCCIEGFQENGVVSDVIYRSNGTIEVSYQSYVNGTEGTPTATKGTVSNHSVSVTPSVTNTRGFIDGGSHTGTAVTVSASELDSGTKSISANGTGIDVVGYAAVDVNVSGGGGNDFIVTLSKVNGVWTPDCTFAEIQSAFNTGKTIAAKTDDESCIADGQYDVHQDAFYYTVDSFDYTTDGYTTQWYIYDSNGITDDGNVIYYQTNDADAVPSDVAQGKIFFNANGYQTGTSTAITPTGSISITDVVDPVTGGTARYINAVDISDTTAEAADVAQGKYFYTAAGVKTAGTSSGGGGSSLKALNFIDYDGTIVNSYTAQEVQALSELPANPSHTGLVAQGWNWSLANIKSYLQDYPDATVNVGQMYITQSGATEIDVTFDDANFLSPYLAIAPNGTVVVDWGDGSATDTVTGTSTTTLKYTQHVYSQTGSYTIKLTVSSGRFDFYGNQNYVSVLRTVSAANNRTRNMSYSGCITAIRLGSNVSIGTYAFQFCSSLTSLTIPNTVTSIGTSAFANCYTLASITIPATVTSIGNNVFSYCHYLTSIIIPDTVTSIGTSAFANCYTLASITIPATVTSIGAGAFQSCYGIASFIIPDTVTSIGNNVFTYCYSLTSITIPDRVTIIDNSTFSSCYTLASITVPDGVTSIGSSAFSNCYTLTSITIPDTVTSISSNTFYNCYILTSLTIPDTVTSIGSNMFYSCYSLTSINIPDGVTSIGASAFSGCYSLTSITIPDIVTSIGAGAFQNCYNMEEYHLLPTTPPTLGANAFSGIMTGTKIYVPYSEDHSILDAYKTATNWSTYASYMEEESN